MRIVSVGHVAFAVAVIGIGVVGLVDRDVMPVWQPPDDAPVRAALIYASIAVSLATGAGLLWRRTQLAAARIFLGYLALWWIAWSLHDLITAPKEFGAWDGCAETGAIVAAAWLVYAQLAPAGAFATSPTSIRLARTLYGLALVPFGIAHFLYLDRTTSMVPGWLPGHLAWACFTGGAFIAAGAGIATGVLARLAAALIAVEVAAFTVLVWLPMIADRKLDPFEWLEVATSVVLLAAGWVVAESYRGVPWLSIARNRPLVLPE